MVFEERLRYIKPEGARIAIVNMGWAWLGKQDGRCRFGGDGDLRLPAVFPSRPLYTRIDMKEMIEALGIDYVDFEVAYVQAYNGDPPIAGM